MYHSSIVQATHPLSRQLWYLPNSFLCHPLLPTVLITQQPGWSFSDVREHSSSLQSPLNLHCTAWIKFSHCPCLRGMHAPYDLPPPPLISCDNLIYSFFSFHSERHQKTVKSKPLPVLVLLLRVFLKYPHGKLMTTEKSSHHRNFLWLLRRPPSPSLSLPHFSFLLSSYHFPAYFIFYIHLLCSSRPSRI